MAQSLIQVSPVDPDVASVTVVQLFLRNKVWLESALSVQTRAVDVELALIPTLGIFVETVKFALLRTLGPRATVASHRADTLSIACPLLTPPNDVLGRLENPRSEIVLLQLV